MTIASISASSTFARIGTVRFPSTGSAAMNARIRTNGQPTTLSSSANEQWILGKSGFKAIQYLAVGVPFVMSPVGVCAEIGEVNVTHFNAVSPEDWYNSLSRLISDAALRKTMGADGRKYSLEHYSVSVQASVLAEAMKSVCGKKFETTD